MDAAYVQRFSALVGRSRTISGAMYGLIEWLERQSPDVRSVIFDGDLTPDTQAEVMEKVAKQTKTWAAKLRSEGKGTRPERPQPK